MQFAAVIPNLRIVRGPFRGLSFYQLLAALALGVLMVLIIRVFFVFNTSTAVLLMRSTSTAVVVLLAFTLASNVQVPRLPRHAARFLAIAVASPLALLGAYALTIPGGFEDLCCDNWGVISGWIRMTSVAVGISLVATLIYIYLERDREARDEALRFALERRTLEKDALNARLKVLQAQVEPHFLFNTLANVQQLVEMRSERAAPLLRTLIQYLKLTVRESRDDMSTLGREMELVQHYLDIMRMRMPDRLRFAIDLPPELAATPIPPLAVLTLVENAVRHGLDPSEEGGEIHLCTRAEARGIHVQVSDTGRGLQPSPSAPGSSGSGTGLATLRERLEGHFGSAARLELSENSPQGVIASIWLPAALGQTA